MHKDTDHSDTDHCVVLCTCQSLEKAKALAHALLNEKLVACVNCIPSITSIYSWDGKIVEDTECLLVIKSTSAQFDTLKEKIVELHDYDVPEVIQINIENGHQPYLDWISSCTKKP